MPSILLYLIMAQDYGIALLPGTGVSLQLMGRHCKADLGNPLPHNTIEAAAVHSHVAPYWPTANCSCEVCFLVKAV